MVQCEIRMASDEALHEKIMNLIKEFSAHSVSISSDIMALLECSEEVSRRFLSLSMAEVLYPSLAALQDELRWLETKKGQFWNTDEASQTLPARCPHMVA